MDLINCAQDFGNKKQELISSIFNSDTWKTLSIFKEALPDILKFIIDLLLFICIMPLIPFFYIIAVGIYTIEFISKKLQKL